MVDSFTFYDGSQYSLTLSLSSLYIVDANNFKAVAIDNSQFLIVMSISTATNTIVYKKTLIDLSTLTMIRTSRFYDENEVLIALNGRKFMPNYLSNTEYLYAGDGPN